MLIICVNVIIIAFLSLWFLVVAVAAGPYIYVYKNLRPYYRFTMPDLEINKAELDAWNKFKEVSYVTRH